jgi:hypothetical protein
MNPPLKKALVELMTAARRALTRGVIAVIAFEVSFLIMGWIGGGEPIAQIIWFRQQAQPLDWVVEYRMLEGAFAVGALNGALNAPLWPLILGEALSPWALVFTLADNLSGHADEREATVMPLATTLIAALPTVSYLFVRGAAWGVSRFKKPEPSVTPGDESAP